MTVSVGSSELKVAVAVDESAAVCTPFAADCAAGTWCPPTGLSAAARMHCGGHHRSWPAVLRADCIANASCFDFGGGPVELLAEVATQEAKFAAAEAYFDEYGVPPLTAGAVEQIEAEWRGVTSPKKRRRKAA